MTILMYWLNFFGLNIKLGIVNIKGLPYYFHSKKELKKNLNLNEFPFGRAYPVLSDRKDSGGIMSGHYFHQDLLIAQKIFNHQPKKIVDIGSRTDGFVAHIACFREIEVFDIRPLTSKVKNILFKRADLMNPQPYLLHYTDAISCLHVIEHFGLGRYNDPIDPNGHIKGLNNIYNILKPGGIFYFSTPISNFQRIEFNAHRIFSISYLINIFKDNYQILEFHYVNDKGDLIEDQIIDNEFIASFKESYACGIFIMKKK